MCRRIFRPPFIIAVTLISACAGTPKLAERPAWVDGQSERYSHRLYLTGQGSADTLEDAKDRARADLAKQFEVALWERSQQQQEYRKQQDGEESSESLEQRVSRQLISRTTRTIQGIEIAATWQDEASRSYHALALLSRNKARQQFEQQITALDRQIEQRLIQAESENDPLRKAGLLQQAVDTHLQRSSAQGALQVVDPSGRGLPPSVSMGELLRTRDSLIKRIKLLPKTEGPLAFLIQPILSGNTANAGFRIGTGAEADYTLIAATKLEPPLQEGGWIWLRGSLELTLRDNDDHDVGVRRWPLKVASITIEQAENRLLNDIDGILKNDLRATVLGFVVTE